MSKTITRIDEKLIRKTPRGFAIWPKLIIPETKFDPAGVYEIRMSFNPTDEAAFLKEMTAIYDEAYEQVRREQATTKELPRETPPWRKNKAGVLEFKFKLKASGIFDGESWTNKPPKLFDSRGNLIEDPDPEHFKFGKGTEVRTLFQIRPYFVQKAGITLRLKAVQLLKFVPYDDAAFFGIEDEDDVEGFVYTAPSAKRTPANDGGNLDLDEHAPIVIDDDDAPASTTTITDNDIPF